MTRTAIHSAGVTLAVALTLELLFPALCVSAPAVAAPRPLTPDDGVAIADALLVGRGEGLAEPDLRPLAPVLASPDPQMRRQADEALSAAAVALAQAERGMPADPASIDPDWVLRAPYDAAADFAAARAAGRVAVWAKSLARTDPEEIALFEARKRYAAIVATGGWPVIGPGAALKLAPPATAPKHPKPPTGDPRVPALRQRLAAEGYLPAPGPTSSTFYDAPLAAAVADFQRRHGLKDDGVLTAVTVAALNVPAQARLATIDANIERGRWLPQPLPPQRIEADIAGPEVQLIENDRPALTMRAIAGDLRHHTPLLASEVDGIVFNPPWVVPASIAAAELYPDERRHPGYLRSHGFSVVRGQLVQAAGPRSSLGYLKFDMTDPYAIYLHDTPARSLFNGDARWLSHGCMRLQQPRELAAALLAPQGWSPAAIDAEIAAKRTVRVALTTRTPVYIVYRTALADAGAPVAFRPDVYGWDAELTAATARPSPSAG